MINAKENYNYTRQPYKFNLLFRTIVLEMDSICQLFDSKGAKLSFVLQEIGREINTTGSKAYDAAIQKCVVFMKDELEKLKEQVFNVL